MNVTQLVYITVNQGEVGIVQRFGKFKAAYTPGLHFCSRMLGYKLVGAVSTRVEQLDVQCETKTKDDVFATLTISVQYRASHPEKAFYSLRNPQQQVRAYIFDVVRGQVAVMPMDEVFEQKDDIAQAVRERLTDEMDEYGFAILTTLVTDCEPAPEVKAAMNAINAAKREKMAAIERAEGEKEKMVRAAKAKSEKLRIDTDIEMTILKEKAMANAVARKTDAEATALECKIHAEGEAERLKFEGRGLGAAIAGSMEELMEVDGISIGDAKELLALRMYTDYMATVGSSAANSTNGSTVFLPHGVSSLQETSEMIRAYYGTYGKDKGKKSKGKKVIS